MRRHAIRPRPNLDARAVETGFALHDPQGAPYWDESAYYSFSLKEIEEELESPTEELSDLCLAFVGRACAEPDIMRRLRIPDHAHELIRESWVRGDPSLYGRFDFAYDGNGPAKLLEFNADTPTALFEAAVFQWVWLEDSIRDGRLPSAADQFNSLHEKLIARFAEIGEDCIHFGGLLDEVEDRGVLAYLQDCARQAGVDARLIGMADIGAGPAGAFVDLDDAPIERLFKLYPWEWMFAEPFSRSPAMRETRFLEPPWKALLSTKGLLPYLWEMAPNHRNLLPAWFEDDPNKFKLGESFARKPLYSREGENVMLVANGQVIGRVDGSYGAEGYVRQGLADISPFDGQYPVIGSWLVGDAACGIGVREDTGRITTDRSRFVPHAIVG